MSTVLCVLPFLINSGTIVSAVFLLLFVFGLLYTILRY